MFISVSRLLVVCSVLVLCHCAEATAQSTSAVLNISSKVIGFNDTVTSCEMAQGTGYNSCGLLDCSYALNFCPQVLGEVAPLAEFAGPRDEIEVYPENNNEMIILWTVHNE